MKFAVIHYDDDFVNCIGICTGYYMAVGIAYDYACSLIEDTESGEKGDITPLYELEGQTGLGLTVRYGDELQCKATIFILKDENGKGAETDGGRN